MVTTHPSQAFEELCGARTPADAPQGSGQRDREPLAFLLSFGEPPSAGALRAPPPTCGLSPFPSSSGKAQACNLTEVAAPSFFHAVLSVLTLRALAVPRAVQVVSRAVFWKFHGSAFQVQL